MRPKAELRDHVGRDLVRDPARQRADSRVEQLLFKALEAQRVAELGGQERGDGARPRAGDADVEIGERAGEAKLRDVA